MDLNPNSATAAAIAALLRVGCSSSTPEQNVRTEAQRQRQLWRHAGIQRYEVTWLFLEGGDDAVDRHRTVHVIAGSVLDTRCPHDQCPELLLRFLRSLLAVDDAFDRIVNAPIDCRSPVHDHATFPLPTRIPIDSGDPSQPHARVFQPE